MRKACVIGDPVSHSLSPRLHQFWLKELGLEGDYQAIRVEKGQVDMFLRSLSAQGFSGCNITVPHKQEAYDAVDELTDAAKKIGAVNLVTAQKDGTLRGDNTDGYGFIENLRAQVPPLKDALRKVMILGAGGATRAIIDALQNEGCGSIILTNRTSSKAENLAQTFENGIEVVAWQDKESFFSDLSLLINTTSLGMKNHSALEVNMSRLPKECVVTDIIYNPLMTSLLDVAKKQGNPIATGLGMLIHQAVPSFEAFFGVRPTVSKAVEANLLEKLS